MVCLKLIVVVGCVFSVINKSASSYFLSTVINFFKKKNYFYFVVIGVHFDICILLFESLYCGP